MATAVELVQQDGERALKLLKMTLGNNADGHLTVSDCMAIGNAIAALETYKLVYPNAAAAAVKAREDAEYNASLTK